MNFLIVVAFRNRPDLLGPCLASIREQTDEDFVVAIGDDASDELGVGLVVSQHLAEHAVDTAAFHRDERMGVVGNQVTMIRESFHMAPEDVIVFLDGDDRFAHSEVIARLREVYSDPHIDLTYGNYQPDPPSETCPKIKAIPPEVCRQRGGYRRWAKVNGAGWNHLRTFRRRIFDAIPETHYKMDGEWLDGGADYALMTPALELAGGRHKMIEEVLVLYTSDRPDAEWRIKSDKIQAGRRYVSRRPPLRALRPLEAT